jgi:hypothetical protein
MSLTGGEPAAGTLPSTPYRIVDGWNQGWHSGRSGELGEIYTADYGHERGLDARSFGELAAARGPLRPVEPITAGDEANLWRLFDAAGRKTIATLAAALESVFHQIRESHGGLQSASGSYEYAKRTLLAGREGSWESVVLIDVVLLGNSLNLANAARGRQDVDARRAAGPSPRVDAAARAAMAEIIHRWVTDPARYTEVAETLASVVSRYCDDKAGAEGWRAVADQWLQPGGLAQQAFSTCYRLFYSLSAHFDPSLI